MTVGSSRTIHHPSVPTKIGEFQESYVHHGQFEPYCRLIFYLCPSAFGLAQPDRPDLHLSHSGTNGPITCPSGCGERSPQFPHTQDGYRRVRRSAEGARNYYRERCWAGWNSRGGRQGEAHSRRSVGQPGSYVQRRWSIHVYESSARIVSAGDHGGGLRSAYFHMGAALWGK